MANRIDVVIDLIRSNGFTSYAEIGVKQGRMLAAIVRATKCTGIGVDPFAAVPNERETYEEWDFDAIKAEYDLNVTGLPITTIADVSQRAAALVHQVDLVFIDAAHDYPNMIEDITAWRPKCKMIAGHDYDAKFPGVMRAVDELVPNRQLSADSVWWANA